MSETFTPRSIDELAASLRELHDARRPFAVVGGGTALGLGNPARASDATLRTTALDEVVDYAPADQTITVQAGMTLDELDRVLAANRQMLPLDAADRARATVGGVVATNRYGRRRLRYGAAKDLIVGVTLVRPDGVVARGGGKVVKNVAGFDLPKLAVGSLGTLGAIASATFRLYPLPEAVDAIAIPAGDVARRDALLAAIVDRRLEPESVALYDAATLIVTFAGTRAGVDAQCAMLVALAGPDASVLSVLERESYEQREAAVRRDGAWRLKLTAPPARSSTIAAAFAGATPAAVPVAYPLLGVAFHAYAELDPAILAQARARGPVVVEAMPDAARGTVDAWGSVPASLPLMRALKRGFDPHGLCNAGRFVGGL